MVGEDSLLGLAKQAKNYYEYWKEYEGKRIRIRKHSIQVGEGEKPNRIRQHAFVIEGEVTDVTSYPPGFLLTDVEERLAISTADLIAEGMEEGYSELIGQKKDEKVLRTIEEKYVSFDAIDELERADIAEKSTEPFRE